VDCWWNVAQEKGSWWFCIVAYGLCHTQRQLLCTQVIQVICWEAGDFQLLTVSATHSCLQLFFWVPHTLLWRSVTLICGALEEHLLTYLLTFIRSLSTCNMKDETVNSPATCLTAANICWDSQISQHTHSRTTVLRPFTRDYPGEPVPEVIFFWTSWCQGRYQRQTHQQSCWAPSIQTN